MLSAEFLDDVEAARPWLVRCGFRHLEAAHRDLKRMAERGIPRDLWDALLSELTQWLPGSADPEMAIRNLDRFIGNSRSPLSTVTYFHRQPRSLAVLVQLFSSSQFFSDLIIENPEYFDFVLEQGNQPLDPRKLYEEILGEIRAVHFAPEAVLAILRQHRAREQLRIGFRDVIGGEPLDRIAHSISDLADCLLEVALKVAYHRCSLKWGEPRTLGGQLCRVVVLGLGKLGGSELNYSSDIDLMVIYEEDGRTNGHSPRCSSVPNREFFTGVVQDLVQSLSSRTADGFAYRVDLRLRPHGGYAELCQSLHSTLDYYDKHGRTWERQALVKARPVAGFKPLGQQFLREVEPFIYGRYLSFVQINEIKSMKRRIERKTLEQGADETDLKTGRGGIRDIEFVVQFLQLLNGGVFPKLRQSNTLRALRELVACGCLNQDEETSLETGYRFLRKAEHRLQFMFDLQTHRIPDEPFEVDKLAMRLGYVSGTGIRPGEEFLSDLRMITERQRTILKHLMIDLFPDPVGTVGEEFAESDLILDPEPSDERITQVLTPYHFVHVKDAYHNLTLLGTEEVPFLSSIRCRHFLAGIARPLLEAVSVAPDPDMALVNLEKVAASIGAKGVLWESLSQSPPMLSLFVHLCSWSQFLSEILINNPGMIDELLDSLVMNRSPNREERQIELERLVRGAEDLQPILHSYKNTSLLGIGVQDILGKSDIRQTKQSLSDVAEILVGVLMQHHEAELVARYGAPMLADDRSRRSRFALIALGKLGGQELGYHGDLDLMLLYEGDGSTESSRPSKSRSISNFEFYTQLMRSVVKSASAMTPAGRLYAIDLRLRPDGRSGSLVTPITRLESYRQNAMAIWERLAMTRARVIFGDPAFGDQAMHELHRSLTEFNWERTTIPEILSMRSRLAESRRETDIKRGVGGQLDIEFAVQMTCLRHARLRPTMIHANLWDALDSIEELALWPSERCAQFRSAYSKLCVIESRIRIVYNVARSELPTSRDELEKLAHRAGYADGAELSQELFRLAGYLQTEFQQVADELH